MRSLWRCAALAAALASCTSDGAGARRPATPAFLADDLRTALEGAGNPVVPIGRGNSIVSEDVEAQWWCAADVVLGVHEYPDGDAAADDLERLQEDLPGAMDMVAPLRFYATDRLIVEAFGGHEALAPTLVAALGPPLDVQFFGFAPTLPCDEFTL